MAIDEVRAEAALVDVHGTPTLVRTGGRGEPILFLHGLEDPAWAPALARLAARFRVVAPDHPGMGRTALPAAFDSIGDLVDHYLDLIDTLALDAAAVVGVPFGGWIAAELAVVLGPRLRRLVLANAGGLRVGDADLPEIFLMPDDELARFLVGDPRSAGRVFAAGDDPALFEQRIVQRATLARFTWHPYWHDPKLIGRLRRIAAPTLVLWGARDRFIPLSHAHEYAARIPRARVHVLEDAGHLPHLEQPERFADAVGAFAAG